MIQRVRIDAAGTEPKVRGVQWPQMRRQQKLQRAAGNSCTSRRGDACGQLAPLDPHLRGEQLKVPEQSHQQDALRELVDGERPRETIRQNGVRADAP